MPTHHYGADVYMTIPPDMLRYGARVEYGTPTPGIDFYDLTGATVRLGVNAVCECHFYGAGGVPKAALTVVNLRADGKGEIQQTDGAGRVAFMFGSQSAFTPSDGTPPPLTIFAVDAATKDDETKIVTYGQRLSDAVLVGDSNALHTEWSIQFVLHAPDVVQPPPNELPVLADDEALRAYCMKQGYAASIDYLPEAALTKAARTNGWGAPINNEFRYLDGAAVRMAAQAFMLRIATCPEGAWDQIAGVAW